MTRTKAFFFTIFFAGPCLFSNGRALSLCETVFDAPGRWFMNDVFAQQKIARTRLSLRSPKPEDFVLNGNVHINAIIGATLATLPEKLAIAHHNTLLHSLKDRQVILRKNGKSKNAFQISLNSKSLIMEYNEAKVLKDPHQLVHFVERFAEVIGLATVGPWRQSDLLRQIFAKEHLWNKLVQGVIFQKTLSMRLHAALKNTPDSSQHRKILQTLQNLISKVYLPFDYFLMVPYRFAFSKSPGEVLSRFWHPDIHWRNDQEPSYETIKKHAERKLLWPYRLKLSLQYVQAVTLDLLIVATTLTAAKAVEIWAWLDDHDPQFDSDDQELIELLRSNALTPEALKTQLRDLEQTPANPSPFVPLDLSPVFDALEP